MSEVFRTIIWPRRKLLFIGFILIVISRLTGIFPAMAIRQLIDNIVPNKDFDGLIQLILLVVGAIAIQAITSFVLTKILSVEAQNLISQLRVQVQKKILSLPVSFFDNNKSGALVSRIMSDVEGVRNLVGTGLVQLIGGTLTAIVCVVLLIGINPMMTLSTILPISLFGIIALKAFGKIRPIFKKRGQINAQVTGRLTESLNGVRVIKGFNAEVQENRIFEEGTEELFQNVKASLTATALITSSATLLLGIASAIVMLLGGHYMIKGEITSGQFMEFMGLLAFMIAPIVQMSNIGSQISEAFAGLDRTQEIMNRIPEDDPERRTIHVENLKGEIVFDNVSFGYEEEKEVLHDISFRAPAGSVTALVGSSGSGKTTIAGLVATFLTPNSGVVTVDGQDLSKFSLSSYRQQLGVVLQDDFLFQGSIRENILFPRPEATSEQLDFAVKSAYVNEFTDRFEDGLDTIIGERGVKLSGGQKQRITIARAILANPAIFILDEATSNLDTESEALIQQSLSQLIKDRTTFVIAHRLSTIRQADQILVIENGRIAEKGNHEDLISKKGRYFDLFTYQSRI
jgi:ABC-type multidrug transport system fused ATPase/permease subunit